MMYSWTIHRRRGWTKKRLKQQRLVALAKTDTSLYSWVLTLTDFHDYRWFRCLLILPWIERIRTTIGLSAVCRTAPTARSVAAGFGRHVMPRRPLMTQVQHWAKTARADHVTLRPWPLTLEVMAPVADTGRRPNTSSNFFRNHTIHVFFRTKPYGTIPTNTGPIWGRMQVWYEKSRFSTNISLYTGNDTR